MKKLSKRLSACLDALSPLSSIADIGTDHAYLPCFGVSNGILERAIAIDVIDGPLRQARATIADYGLAEKIELRKGSGLQPLAVGEVDGVNIAGMGGKLIAQLLQDSLPVAKSMKRLVLQPQTGEATLRRTLFENDFAIVDEQLLEEDGLIYTIIIAEPRPSGTEFTELDVEFGPILRRDVANQLFRQKWQHELDKIDEALGRIPADNPRRTEFEQRKQLIKGVLRHVENS